MSAALIPLRRPASIEALAAQLADVDAEIEEALARLAADEVSDDDVAALRAKRSRILDRVEGAKLLVQRAAERAAAEEREQNERTIAELLAVVDAVPAFLAEQAQLSIETHRVLRSRMAEIRSRLGEAHEAARRATAIARQLGREIEPRVVRVDHAIIHINRAVGADLVAQGAEAARDGLRVDQLVIPSILVPG